METVITATIATLTILTTVQLPSLADISTNTELWNPTGTEQPKESKGTASR